MENILTEEDSKILWIRKALNVPDGIRIAQHIHNANRDSETGVSIRHGDSQGIIELSAGGIDIFNQEDKMFMHNLNRVVYE